MTERKCPLCNQPVSEKLFAEITGIWKVRDKEEKEFKAKKARLDNQMKAQRAAHEREKAAIIRKASADLTRQVEAKTKALVSDKAKLQAEVKKAQSASEAKVKAALRQADKRHLQDRASLGKQLSDLRTTMKRQKAQSDQATLKAVAEAKKLAAAQAAQSTRAGLEASMRREIAKVTKETKKAAAKETKTLNLALRSATSQFGNLKATNAKMQVKVEKLERELAAKTTPQHEGLVDEKRLMDALQKQHPKDQFVNTGKGGDILQTVMEGGKPAGVIIYECKRVQTWSNSHLEQAAAAKLLRKADYAVLVTNAIKKNSTGFFLAKDVVVVHTGGAMATAAILRNNLVEVAGLKLGKAERDQAVALTMTYLQSPEFANAMDVIIRKSFEMADDMKKEQREHLNAWGKRHENLKTVYVSAATVQLRTQMTLTGKEAPTEKLAIAPFSAPGE